MRILFLTGRLSHHYSANEKIIIQNAKALSAKGHTVTVCGWSDEITGRISSMIEDGVLCIRIRRKTTSVPQSKALPRKYYEAVALLEGYTRRYPKNRMKKICYFTMRHPMHTAQLVKAELLDILQRWNRNRNSKKEEKQCANFHKNLRKTIHEMDPEAIVFSYLPFDYIEQAMNSIDMQDYPCYLYQMDPVGLHEFNNPNQDVRIIQRELSLIDRTKGMFTTPVLYEQYKKHVLYQLHIQKIHPIEFPNIRPIHTACPTDQLLNKDYINLVFCGIVNDEYRNPKACLDLLEHAIRCGVPIHAHFFGSVYTPTLMEAAAQYSQNIFLHPQVDVQTAIALQNDADYLLNIGNSLSNQIPSKIFDYFSLGKPVINIQKIKQCPARYYFDKYPLAFTVEEWHLEDYKDALHTFLLDTDHEELTYEHISELYRECTPEYVADEILKIL